MYCMSSLLKLFPDNVSDKVRMIELPSCRWIGLGFQSSIQISLNHDIGLGKVGSRVCSFGSK